MDHINIKYLAKELHLSISTVSRALRDSYEISAATKERVLALSKKLNYQPNPNASSLRKQKTKTIAVVIPEISNNFFALAIDGIEKVAQEHDYHLLIYLTHENHKREITYLHNLSHGRVDGVLLSMSSQSDDIQHLLDFSKRGIPLVFFDRVCSSMDNIKVTTDDYDSSIAATEHLIKSGCKKIAFLMVSKNISIGKIRMQGYIDALSQNKNIQLEPLILECTNDINENKRLIKELILSETPDGIFASVENLAILCYSICKEIKISIPEYIKIICFSNLQTAPLLDPSLTTITQPAFIMGETAANMLLKKIENKPRHETLNNIIILRSKLIKGNSTGYN